MSLYDISWKECKSIKKEVVSEPRVHGLIGVGRGMNYYVAEADPSYMGLRIYERYDVEDGFKDSDGILISHTEAKYADRQNDYQYKLELARKRKIALEPGLFLTFHPRFRPAESLSLAKFSEDPGKISLELGKASPNYDKLTENEQSVSRGFTKRYIRELHNTVSAAGTTFYPSDIAHQGAPAGSLSFSVPAGVKNASDLPRITLALSIGISTSVSNVALGRVGLWTQINGVNFAPGIIPVTKIGGNSVFDEMDATGNITAGTTNTVTVYAYMAKNYAGSHSAYTEHPQLTLGGTMYFFGRKNIK